MNLKCSPFLFLFLQHYSPGGSRGEYKAKLPALQCKQKLSPLHPAGRASQPAREGRSTCCHLPNSCTSSWIRIKIQLSPSTCFISSNIWPVLGEHYKQTQTRQVSWCCLIRIVKCTTRSPISGLSVPQAPAKHQLSPKTSLSHHHSCGHLSCPSSSFKNTDDVAFSVYKATSPEACSSSSLGALRQNCHGLLKAGTQFKTAHISFFRVLKEQPCPRGDRYQRGNFLICNSSRKSQTK